MNDLSFAKARYILNKISDKIKKDYVSVIICAAGSGQRMGGVSKQLLSLNGKPCILYSLEKFQNMNEINEIIISAKESEIDIISEIAKDNNITKLKCIAVGGNTRQESVYNAFMKVSSKSSILLIHDAARPAFLINDIQNLIENAKKFGAATASTPCTDTAKLSDGADGFIKRTVSRENLFLVQTPQAFKTDIYRIALVKAQKNKTTFTDDNQLVENAGFRIKLCSTSKYNIKITTKDDIKIAEKILAE